MCDVNGPFKLCTCGSKVNKLKPYWILHRYLQSKEEYQLLGQFYLPNPYNKISNRSLKRRLNSVNVFDFEYDPQEGDYLELFISPYKEAEEIEFPDFELEFINGKWKLLEEFISNEYKHSARHVGVIKGPVTELTVAYKHFRNTPRGRNWDYFNFFEIGHIVPHNLNTKRGLLEFFKSNFS
jgi:hypothetical protein